MGKNERTAKERALQYPEVRKSCASKSESKIGEPENRISTVKSLSWRDHYLSSWNRANPPTTVEQSKSANHPSSKRAALAWILVGTPAEPPRDMVYDVSTGIYRRSDRNNLLAVIGSDTGAPSALPQSRKATNSMPVLQR